MSNNLPNDVWLQAHAGVVAYKRGVAYFHDARIVIDQHAAAAISGEAHGSEVYRWQLDRAGSDWRIG